MDEPTKKKLPPWAKIALWIGLGMLLLLLLCAGLIALYVNSLLNKVNYVTDHPTRSSVEASSIAQQEWEPIPSGDTTPVEEDFTTEKSSPFMALRL